MPPQPISSTASYRRKRSFGFTRSPFVFDAVPSLGLPFAKVITTCGYLEHELADMFAAMLGSHAPVAMAMYAQLSRTASQRDALNGAAADVLSPRNLELFTAVMSIVRAAFKERNDVAHSLWAVDSDDLPDAMLRLDTGEVLGTAIRVYQMGLEAKSVPEPKRKNFAYDPSKIFIYRAQEFEDVRLHLLRAVILVQQLRGVVDPRSSQDDDKYHQLLAEPDVQEVVRRQRGDRKTQPEAMPSPQQTPPLADKESRPVEADSEGQ